jgi:hypothetical protein
VEVTLDDQGNATSALPAVGDDRVKFAYDRVLNLLIVTATWTIANTTPQRAPNQRQRVE